jgi:hypothetical protein
MNIYTSFKQWKKSGFIEYGKPRKQEYTKEETALIERGYRHGYDAALRKINLTCCELVEENQK